MDPDILKPSSLPIHMGINNRGSLFRQKRQKKDSQMPSYYENSFSLMVGTPDTSQNDKIKIKRSTLRLKNHFRNFSQINQNISNTMSMTQRQIGVSTPKKIKKQVQQRPTTTSNFEGDSDKIGFTWRRWTHQQKKQKKSFRITNKVSHIPPFNESYFQQANNIGVDSPSKIVGYQISARSPMNKKLSLYFP